MIAASGSMLTAKVVVAHTTTWAERMGLRCGSRTPLSHNRVDNSTFDGSCHPLHTSTPTRISRQDIHKNGPLRLLNINVRSAVGKMAEIANMMVCTRPDVVIGTETWTDSTI